MTIVADTSAPVLHRKPNNQAFGSLGGITKLWWNASDFNPSIYIIYKNNTVVNTTTWVSYQAIEYFVNTSEQGVYNITIVIADSVGHSIKQEIIVTISADTTPPSVTGNNKEIQEGAPDVYLEFIITDSNPFRFTLYQNGTQVDTGPLNYTTTTYRWNISHLAVGTYNFSLIAEDINGNEGEDYLIVHVKPDSTAPTIVWIQSITIKEGDAMQLEWQLWDSNPDWWKLYQDDVEIAIGTWTNAEIITHDLSTLTTGFYVFKFEASDKAGNVVVKTSNVNVLPASSSTDITPPEIYQYQATYSLPQGETGHVLEWTARDDNPSTFRILIDGNEEYSDTWTSDVPVSWGLDSIANVPGTHVIVIEFSDLAGNMNSVSTDVKVESSEPPKDDEDASPGFLDAPFNAVIIAFLFIGLYSKRVFKRKQKI